MKTNKCTCEEFDWSEQCDYCKGEPDNVNYPEHYCVGGIETLDYMKAKFDPKMFEGFLIGNVIKYVSRYQYKNGREDLKKAQFYLNKVIEYLEG